MPAFRLGQEVDNEQKTSKCILSQVRVDVVRCPAMPSGEGVVQELFGIKQSGRASLRRWPWNRSVGEVRE